MMLPLLFFSAGLGYSVVRTCQKATAGDMFWMRMWLLNVIIYTAGTTFVAMR